MGRDTIRSHLQVLAAASLLEGPADALPDLAVLTALVRERLPAPEAQAQSSSFLRWHDEIVRLHAKGAGPTAIHHHLRLNAPDYAAKARLLELATCSFVERQENVLLVGPTGVGKSHLAQALGERACRAGHSVGYVAAHRMLATLRASRADQSYEKKLLRFTTPDLLIIDDLGLPTRKLNTDFPCSTKGIP
jgi:hypothetical protein